MLPASQRALLVIDLQNDYFPGGKFPLWNSEATLAKVEQAIARAHSVGMPVILVQHIADAGAPFFEAGSSGAEIHPAIRAAAPDAPIVVKAFADSFHQTTLQETLAQLGVGELLVCGMMTQNCVTHTAISRAADAYQVSVVADCCTTVSEMLHLIALKAVSTRLKVAPADSLF